MKKDRLVAGLTFPDDDDGGDVSEARSDLIRLLRDGGMSYESFR